MMERMANGLSAALGGEPIRLMPASREWGVTATRPDGRFVSLEDHAGWTYCDRPAFDAHSASGDPDAVVQAEEWDEWDGGERWARGLARVLGSEEYWHSGGGIWLVFYKRPDGRLAVVGSESGAVYDSREAFEDDDGQGGENHHFI